VKYRRLGKQTIPKTKYNNSVSGITATVGHHHHHCRELMWPITSNLWTLTILICRTTVATSMSCHDADAAQLNLIVVGVTWP